MKLVGALFLTLSLASVAAAQKVETIDPGMAREQVVARLGEPLSAHSYENFTYLLYRNGCEKKCGMNDLVVLDSGKVVDAVFRSPSRKYTGTSSSPHMLSAEQAKSGSDAATMKVPEKSREKIEKAPPPPPLPSSKKPNH
jgi:hypothetical protein